MRGSPDPSPYASPLSEGYLRAVGHRLGPSGEKSTMAGRWGHTQAAAGGVLARHREELPLMAETPLNFPGFPDSPLPHHTQVLPTFLLPAFHLTPCLPSGVSHLSPHFLLFSGSPSGKQFHDLFCCLSQRLALVPFSPPSPATSFPGVSPGFTHSLLAVGLHLVLPLR